MPCKTPEQQREYQRQWIARRAKVDKDWRYRERKRAERESNPPIGLCRPARNRSAISPFSEDGQGYLFEDAA